MCGQLHRQPIPPLHLTLTAVIFLDPAVHGRTGSLLHDKNLVYSHRDVQVWVMSLCLSHLSNAIAQFQCLQVFHLEY